MREEEEEEYCVLVTMVEGVTASNSDHFRSCLVLPDHSKTRQFTKNQNKTVKKQVPNKMSHFSQLIMFIRL